MSKFKVGDTVFLSNETYERGAAGDKATIVHHYDDKMYGLLLESGKDKGLTCVKFEREFNLINPDYESSNRYKLKQAIKETGISSRKLSHFAVGNESFFYNQTGPARFKEYGDISWSKLDELIDMVDIAKERLNAKITQDAFDEREKLDLAAKTVDENNVPVKKFTVDDFGAVVDLKDLISLSTNIPKSKLFGSSNESDCGNSDIEDYYRYINESTGIVEAVKKGESYIDQLQSQAIEKRDYRLRNLLIALIVFALLLAFYFFKK